MNLIRENCIEPLKNNQIQDHFGIKFQELSFINNPMIRFNISLSQSSLRKVLLSDKWSWIGNKISNEILNLRKLEDIKIKNGKLFMKTSQENITINQGEQININTERGKVYLENKKYNKKIEIPIEDKIYIENIEIEDNLINIYATSTISL